MTAECREYTLYSDQDLSNISDYVRDKLLSWSHEWLSNAEVNICETLIFSDFHNNTVEMELQNHITRYTDAKWCGLHFFDNGHGVLGLSLCGVSNINYEIDESCIAATVSSKAIRKLSKSFLLDDDLSGDLDYNSNVSAYAATPGSGCVCVLVEIDELQFYISLSEDICKKLVVNKAKKHQSNIQLVSIKEALRATPIHMDILLGNVQLDVKSLSKLDVGDVIEIDKRISELCDVSVCGSKVNIGSHIGRVNGMAAAKLISK